MKEETITAKKDTKCHWCGGVITKGGLVHVVHNDQDYGKKTFVEKFHDNPKDCKTLK